MPKEKCGGAGCEECYGTSDAPCESLSKRHERATVEALLTAVIQPISEVGPLPLFRSEKWKAAMKEARENIRNVLGYETNA